MPIRIVRFVQLGPEKGISFCRMHIGRLEKADQFPKRVKIGANSVGWIEQEIDDWLAAKAAARDAVPSETPEPVATVTPKPKRSAHVRARAKRKPAAKGRARRAIKVEGVHDDMAPAP